MIALWMVGVVVLSAEAAEPPVARVTGASSQLEAKTKVLEWTGERYAWRAATFGPQSAMDGSEATAWCEGAKGRGMGEWLEIELTQAVDEIEIVPGFRKLAIGGGADPEASEAEHAQFAQSLAVYRSNGRPSILEVVGADGKVLERLAVGDRYTGRYVFAVSLAPGRYRLRIARVEPGTKHEDACIAELKFTRAEPGPAPSAVPEDVPDQVRALLASKTCQREGTGKLLPRSVKFFRGRQTRSMHVQLAITSADGRLLPTTSLWCITGAGLPGGECGAEGEQTGEERPESAVADFPAWRLGLKLPVPGSAEQGRWTGEYAALKGEPLDLKVEAEPPHYTVTASRDGAVVEAARYRCTPAH